MIKKLLELALSRVGCKYVLGANVPKDQANYKGAFDCAEFVAWCNYQTFGILYGVDSQVPHKADAYTGYFARDAERKGIKITVQEAVETPGAMLLRKGVENSIGHVVFSLGNGKTIEAMGKAYGVKQGVTTGRRWDYGILLPEVTYERKAEVVSKPPAMVYRLKSPLMHGDFVKEIQMALGIKTDGFYGRDTVAAVVKFQKAKGLIPDGEVSTNGETAKALHI